MGLLSKIGESFGGSKQQQDWTETQQNSSTNEFSMPDPNLRGMATGDTSTIPVLTPIAKLTETAVELEEDKAEQWREQEQLHGRFEGAKTSVFESHSKISETQFIHGTRRVKRGLKARDVGATKFGEYMFSKARPEFISQNYRVKLSQDAGNHVISQLGKQYEESSAQYNNYVEEM